jgi:hypothetical protein
VDAEKADRGGAELTTDGMCRGGGFCLRKPGDEERKTRRKVGAFKYILFRNSGQNPSFLTRIRADSGRIWMGLGV